MAVIPDWLGNGGNSGGLFGGMSFGDMPPWLMNQNGPQDLVAGMGLNGMSSFPQGPAGNPQGYGVPQGGQGDAQPKQIGNTSFDPVPQQGGAMPSALNNMPVPQMPSLPSLSAIFGGGQPQPGAQPGQPGSPGIGDRLGAAGAGFFNAGSPMQAIGNLIGGIATGHRQDAFGIAQQQQQQAQQAAYQALKSAGLSEQEAVGGALNPHVADFLFKVKQARLAQSNADREFNLKENDFKTVPFGGTALNKKGEVVYSANTGDMLLDQPTLKTMAEQYRAGDTTVMQNLRGGAQGLANTIALRKEINAQTLAAGGSGKDLAASNFEAFGTKAGERALGTRSANMDMAVTEAQKMAPLALAASNAVDRTRFPTLNSLLLAFEKGTGDESVTRLGIATNSLINIYARAISGGAGTVSDKEHARELLGNAWSKGQYAAGVDQLMQEMAAARASPGEVRKQLRESVTGAPALGATALPQTMSAKPDPLGIR